MKSEEVRNSEEKENKQSVLRPTANPQLSLNRNVQTERHKGLSIYAHNLAQYYNSYKKQSLREQLLILGLVVSTLLIVYIVIRWVPLQNDLAREQHRLERLQTEIKSLKIPEVGKDSEADITTRINKLKDKRAKLEHELKPVVSQWVKLDDPSQLERHKLAISALAKRSGLEVLSTLPQDIKRLQGSKDTGKLTDRSAELTHQYGRKAFKYEMRGGFYGLRRFMDGLQQLKYRTSIGQFDIAVYDPRTESGRQRLNMTLVLVL